MVFVNGDVPLVAAIGVVGCGGCQLWSVLVTGGGCQCLWLLSVVVAGGGCQGWSSVVVDSGG